MAKLAGNQGDIAKVLGLTQQSVSGKLRGNIVISLEELKRLAAHYQVPLSYFFLDQDVAPSMLAAWDRLAAGPVEVQQALALASQLPREFTIQLWTVVRAMAETIEAVQSQA